MADEIKWQGQCIETYDQEALGAMAEVVFRSGRYDPNLEDEATDVWHSFWAEKTITLLNGPEMSKIHPDLIKIQPPLVKTIPPVPGFGLMRFMPENKDQYVSKRIPYDGYQYHYEHAPMSIFWLDLQKQDLSPEYASVPIQGTPKIVPFASNEISTTTDTFDSYNPKYRQICSPLLTSRGGFFPVQLEVSDTAECPAPTGKPGWSHLEKSMYLGPEDGYADHLFAFFKSLPATVSPYGLKASYNPDYYTPSMFAVYTESLPPTCMDLGDSGKWVAVPYYDFYSQGTTFKWRYQVFDDIEALVTALNAEPNEKTKYLSKFMCFYAYPMMDREPRIRKFYLFIPEAIPKKG